MKIYADTSIFGGVFDKEFEAPSKAFFQEITLGNFELVTSAVVQAEIEPAPKSIQLFFEKFVKNSHIAEVTGETLDLQMQYIKAGIVTEKSLNDALHVAIASVSDCDLIISWNFKHIVHFDKIPKYNAVNTLNGYKQIGIYSPLEIINYDS